MTENLFQTLEEKVMSLLSENEKLRADLQEISQQKNALELEKEQSENRIQEILGLFDNLGGSSNTSDDVHTELVTEQAAG